MEVPINNIFIIIILYLFLSTYTFSQKVLKQFRDPPKEFSVLLFWFLKDTHKDEELIRQISDFEMYNVYSFLIHACWGIKKKWNGCLPKCYGL